MRRSALAALAALSVVCVSGCASPSRSELNERMEEARRIMRASAVHMPPAGVDSCVGVTVRLTEDTPGAETERAELASRVTDAEVRGALREAGIGNCREAYLEGIEMGGLMLEPLDLRVGYGVDPAGRVCAIVERGRPEPIDPGAIPLIDGAAECLKNVLFAAHFPAGRVEGTERIVRFYGLAIAAPGEVETSTVGR